MHRILVTRAANQASELANHLRALGAEPIIIPTIEFTEPSSYGPLDAAIQSIVSAARSTPQPYDVLVFTSANAVYAFARRLVRNHSGLLTQPEDPQESPYGYLTPATELGLPSPAFFRSIFIGAASIDEGLADLLRDGYDMPFQTASIGPATGGALNRLGIYPQIGPNRSTAEDLAEKLKPLAIRAAAEGQPARPNRFLIIRAEEARDVVPDTLREAGADVTIVPAYRTVTPATALDSIRDLFRDPENPPDAITFTSSSTARNLFMLFELAGIDLHNSLKHIEIFDDGKGGFYDNMVFGKVPAFASIGPITSATITEAHYSVSLEASQASVAVLASELVKYLEARRIT